MTRRGFASFIVVILFPVGCYLAVCPLIAELFANRGEYEIALRFDPLNAKYYGEIGRMYLKDGRDDLKQGSLIAAREAYAKAIRLNPVGSKYRLGWGEVEALLLLNKKVISEKEIVDYINNFKKAVELDPTNYYVNATAGYYMLLFRKRIGDKDRNFAIYRLRLALEQNPAYANNIFSYVANGLGDFNLLYKITPQTPQWQQELRDFLRDIDKWKYNAK